MKIRTFTVIGILLGIATGAIGMGAIALPSNTQIPGEIHQYAWWIVILSMLIPLADYLSGIRTTLTGVIARHPYRHLAGFFTGLSFGLGLFLLLSPRLSLLQTLHMPSIMIMLWV